MEEVNKNFVDLPVLLDHAGQRIADLLGAESGIVTPGAAAPGTGVVDMLEISAGHLRSPRVARYAIADMHER